MASSEQVEGGSGLLFPSPNMVGDDNAYGVYDSDDDYGDVYGHHEHHGNVFNVPHQGSNLSRLSMCTSSIYSTNEDVDDAYFDGTGMSMSRLSLESFDADDEEQPSEGKKGMGLDLIITSSDSDKEQSGGGFYSLPSTPPRRRRNSQVGGLVGNDKMVTAKEYASENEAHKGFTGQEKSRKVRRRRRAGGERWLVDGSGDSNKGSGGRREEYGQGSNSFSGESESGGGGGSGSGLVVITRPKGGKRSLCMDLEEVKACRDLGFELEHERMLEIPTGRVSISGSTLDTSSGGNSPIANWRISSPGDDPRDVKARLKVWAQAVALASTSSRHGGI